MSIGTGDALAGVQGQVDDLRGVLAEGARQRAAGLPNVDDAQQQVDGFGGLAAQFKRGDGGGGGGSSRAAGGARGLTQKQARFNTAIKVITIVGALVAALAVTGLLVGHFSALKGVLATKGLVFPMNVSLIPLASLTGVAAIGAGIAWKVSS